LEMKVAAKVKARVEAEVEARVETEVEARVKAQAETQGETNIFQELFAARFGELPDWVHKRIVEAKKGQLVTWAKRLLTSERPEDVFD
jgi:hypothetical protein